jgi:hypothetical protein
MSLRDDRRTLERVGPALAGCFGVLAIPIVLGFALVAWAATSLEGCDVDADFGPFPAGVTGGPSGPITARVPGCGSPQFSLVRLVAPDGSVVWSAEALRPTDVERLTIGRAPPGFRDTVPLPARPLDAEATYDLQLFAIRPTGESLESDVALAFGTTARFRPADLRPDRVWVDGRLVPADRFEQVACAEDDQPS